MTRPTSRQLRKYFVNGQPSQDVPLQLTAAEPVGQRHPRRRTGNSSGMGRRSVSGHGGIAPVRYPQLYPHKGRNTMDKQKRPWDTQGRSALFFSQLPQRQEASTDFAGRRQTGMFMMS